jgi:hypothetical protein
MLTYRHLTRALKELGLEKRFQGTIAFYIIT